LGSKIFGSKVFGSIGVFFGITANVGFQGLIELQDLLLVTHASIKKYHTSEVMFVV
jgi:hypothetical protein